MSIRSGVGATAASAFAAAEQAAGGPARLQVILLLAATLGLDTADKAAVSAVAGSLRGAFHIGNAEIGLIIAAVSFTGAVATLPLGLLVDRISRRRMLIVAIAIWSVAMAVSGTATSFVYLLVVRVFLGGVTATAAPAVASLTGDYFPARERAKVYGLILSGELIGTGVGFFIAGEVSSLFGWRWPFFLMFLPGAALCWAIWRYLPEPARGGQSWISAGQEEVRGAADVADGAQAPDQGAADHHPGFAQRTALGRGIEPRQDLILHDEPTGRSLWWAIGYVVRIPTYVLLVVASSLGYFFFAGVRGFGMIYFTQHYAVPRSILAALVVIVGIGAIAGAIFGGRLSERLVRRGWLEARIVLPGAALFLTVVFIAPAIWTTSIFLGIGLLTVGAALLAAANPPIDAARLDIMHPRLWGRAESGRQTLRALLEGLAPLLFGAMSEWLGGGQNGLMWSYFVMLVPLLVASGLAIPARRTYLRDVATAGASVEATAEAE